MVKKNQSVGIVGLGRVGQRTIEALWGVNEIRDFYFFTGDPQFKGEYWVNSTKAIARERGQKKRRANAAHYDHLHNYLDDLDMIIITSDNSNYLSKVAHGLKREDVLKANLPLAYSLGRKLSGFKGPVINEMNQVDIINYKLCEESGNAPEYFTSPSNIDLNRWRSVVEERYDLENAKPELLDLLRMVLIGPHSEDAVPIFLDMGGMVRDFAPFVKDEDTYQNLKAEFRAFARNQFKLGASSGIGTEAEAANAVKEVVNAIVREEEYFEENGYISLSTFIEPEILGIDSDLPGLFMCYPGRFVDGKFVPNLDLNIEEDSDVRDIAKGFQGLEQTIRKLEKDGTIKSFPERTINLEDYAKKEDKKDKKTRKLHRYFPMDLSVVGAAGKEIFTWPDLNKIVDPETVNLEQRIGSFAVDEIYGETRFLVGHKKGISVINPRSMEEIVYSRDCVGSGRDTKTHFIDGKQYLFGADRNSVFMFDLEKPNKPMIEFRGFYGSLNEFRVEEINGKTNVFVAADGLYQFDIDHPDKPIAVFGDGIFTDVVIDENNIYGSRKAKVLHWDKRIPDAEPLAIAELERSISSFRFAEVFGDNKLFAATFGPYLYQVSGIGAYERIFKKPSGNIHGTHKMQIPDIDGIKYLLAGDVNIRGETKNAGISMWDLTESGEKPLRFLPTYQNHSIRGFGVLK